MGLALLLSLLCFGLSLNNLTVLSASVARLSQISLLSCPDFCIIGNILLLDSSQLEVDIRETFGDSDSNENWPESYFDHKLR